MISAHHYQPNCFNSIFTHTVISILHDMEINDQLVIDNTRKACIFLQCTYDFYTDSTIDTCEEHCQTFQMNYFLFFPLLHKTILKIYSGILEWYLLIEKKKN